MGNVNMEADQIHVRDNSHKTWRTVAEALKALETSSESVVDDITELYTRDASRASKDDIANEFDAELSYFAGDYVYYEGSLFKFTANHSGDWDPADVVIAQIGKDIADFSAAVDYSTTEQPTGQKWIDGKDIYFKVYHVQTMPNNTTLIVEEDFALTKKAVEIKGVCTAVSGNNLYQYAISYYGAGLSDACYAGVTDNDLVVTSKGNWSTYSGYIIVYYTKTA